LAQFIRDNYIIILSNNPKDKNDFNIFAAKEIDYGMKFKFNEQSYKDTIAIVQTF